MLYKLRISVPHSNETACKTDSNNPDMNHLKMKKKALLTTTLLVVIMFAAAGYSDQKEIIFPEISALALGAWVMEKSPWRSPNLHFWLSPTLAALTGTIIMRSFVFSPFFMIAGAFVIVVLQMKLLRSAVLPSLSAAILPVITHADSWYYPLSVCVLTGIIALGRHLTGYSGHGKTDGNGTFNELIHWSKLFVGILIVSAIALKSRRLFMIAPPLIVAFVELSNPGGSLHLKRGKILVLLVLAAITGVFWLNLIHYALHWPVWISACLSVSSVFFFYRTLRLPFPPAVAIALLPAIIPHGSLWSYPWHVLLGSAAFVLISMLWFNNNLDDSPVFPEKPESLSTLDSS
jgi:hypothetical protein